MKRPAPALVIACIALFVALGGTSYAAVQLKKNSVATKHIKNNAVTSAKVKNGSLLAKDFKTGQLPAGAKGDTGARGPSASAAATTTRSSGYDLSSEIEEMFSLNSYADTTTGLLQLDSPARVTVRGDVTLRVDYLGTGYAISFCDLQMNGGGGWVTVGERETFTDDETAAVERQRSITAIKDLAAGSFNFRIVCGSSPGGDHRFLHGAITAIATAR